MPSLTLQFIFRNEPGDVYLAAVSRFILNAYEFGDATAPQSSLPSPSESQVFNGENHTASHARERSNSVAGPHNLPYLSESDRAPKSQADEEQISQRSVW